MIKAAKFLMAVAVFALLSFVPKNDPKNISVVLDAGHGGKDFGVTHGDFTEKEITSRIVEKINSNKTETVRIHLTRVDDDDLSLEQRVEIIDRIKPDLVLSFHVNSHKNTALSGVDIFTPTIKNENREKSDFIARKLSEKLKKDLGMKVRGIKEAQFYLLNNATVPTIVVELGYLTNQSDRAYLTDEKAQDRIANGILEFISTLQ